MDTVTQITLGAAVAAVCVPKQHRRAAVLIGAALGTTPDLDVFIDFGDAVSNFTYHRGFSHSLFVLIPFSILIWAILKKLYQPVRSAPRRWLLAISLALITHPILDAHTAYGTQLFWPLTTPPVMWSTIFIIDPLYTIPLLIGVIVILLKPDRLWASRMLAVSLVVSTGYLAWTWSAKFHVERQIQASLSDQQNIISLFSSPTPFNSLLWRVVILKENSYLEGYYSFLQPGKTVKFSSYSRNNNITDDVKNIWSVKRLEWFAHGYIKDTIIDDKLVISDLRMGFEDNYAFNHAVAKIGNPHFYEIESKLLPSQLGPEDLNLVWKKLLGNQ